MNTATLAQAGRIEQPTSSERLALHWVLLWFVVGNAIVGLIDFDWTQDIAAYAENLEAQPDYDPGSLKGAWYQYLVFPLLDTLGSAELTLSALKGIIFSLLFLSQRRAFKTNIDCALFLSVLLLTPALAKNMTEYLRQGTAFGVLLIALSFSRRIVSVPLAVLALLIHLSVILPLAAVCGAWAMSLGKAKRRTLATFFKPLLLLGCAIIIGLVGGDAIRSIAFESAQEYLSGSRSNLLGLMYLAFFAGYAGIRYTVSDSKPHLPIFIMFLVATASYSVLLNFGRTISLILPLHLAAALTLPTMRARFIDMAAVFVAGTAFAFAASEV